MKWFMSYAYRDIRSERLHLCSHVYTGKHPLKVIEDWEENDPERHHVLLSFQPLPDEPLQRLPEHDCDVIANFL